MQSELPLHPLRVLLVEDSEDDEFLLKRLLKGAGFAVTLQRVDSLPDLRAMMPPDVWDIVISDYKLPDFDGLDSLRVVREFDRDIPFILMSGTVGEDTAVEAMRLGASDYIMKDKSARLPQAIERELRQAENTRTRRRMEQQMDYFARHDVLTGLKNRWEFERHLNELVQDAKFNDRHHVLMYMDLDQFKIINDTAGHVAGDALLEKMGALMQDFIRSKTDIIARLGGDEFGLLMPDCEMERAMQVANGLREAIQQFRFDWDKQIFSIGISIGIVLINKLAISTSQLLSDADNACYAAKAKGRNQVHLFQLHDDEMLQQRDQLKWASLIPEALQQGRFRLYYQKIARLNGSGNDHGGEVLLRMVDQSNNLIMPDRFIPAAERYDLMSAIDRWVVETMFNWLEENQEKLPAGLTVSINLSGRSISDPTMLQFLLASIDAVKFDARRICFEITETAAIGKLGTAINFIAALRAKGARFALDDFGSGMCSFNYLKNLPVDYLKIDGSFVRDIIDDHVARSIVQSVNQIAHAMGMETIAEFVENEQIQRMLQEMGVNYGQGYGIARPVPLDTLLQV
jgi:diguanylate cyclase (GGDEF)-like protein